MSHGAVSVEPVPVDADSAPAAVERCAPASQVIPFRTVLDPLIVRHSAVGIQIIQIAAFPEPSGLFYIVEIIVPVPACLMPAVGEGRSAAGQRRG